MFRSTHAEIRPVLDHSTGEGVIVHLHILQEVVLVVLLMVVVMVVGMRGSIEGEEEA